MPDTNDDRTHLRRTAESITGAMVREWDAGLETELRTCLAQWRFGDALVVAAELDAREAHGCAGSIVDGEGRYRLTDAWRAQRAAEIVNQYRAAVVPREAKTDRGQRLARLGLR
jgi:hypothetical protein